MNSPHVKKKRKKSFDVEKLVLFLWALIFDFGGSCHLDTLSEYVIQNWGLFVPLNDTVEPSKDENLENSIKKDNHNYLMSKQPSPEDIKRLVRQNLISQHIISTQLITYTNPILKSIPEFTVLKKEQDEQEDVKIIDSNYEPSLVKKLEKNQKVAKTELDEVNLKYNRDDKTTVIDELNKKIIKVEKNDHHGESIISFSIDSLLDGCWTFSSNCLTPPTPEHLIDGYSSMNSLVSILLPLLESVNPETIQFSEIKDHVRNHWNLVSSLSEDQINLEALNYSIWMTLMTNPRFELESNISVVFNQANSFIPSNQALFRIVSSGRRRRAYVSTLQSPLSNSKKAKKNVENGVENGVDEKANKKRKFWQPVDNISNSPVKSSQSENNYNVSNIHSENANYYGTWDILKARLVPPPEYYCCDCKAKTSTKWFQGPNLEDWRCESCGDEWSHEHACPICGLVYQDNQQDEDEEDLEDEDEEDEEQEEEEQIPNKKIHWKQLLSEKKRKMMNAKNKKPFKKSVHSKSPKFKKNKSKDDIVLAQNSPSNANLNEFEKSENIPPIYNINSPWIACDNCHRWVMTRCDGITDLSVYDDDNPNHLPYSCPFCRKIVNELPSVFYTMETAKYFVGVSKRPTLNANKPTNEFVDSDETPKNIDELKTTISSLSNQVDQINSSRKNETLFTDFNSRFDLTKSIFRDNSDMKERFRKKMTQIVDSIISSFRNENNITSESHDSDFETEKMKIEKRFFQEISNFQMLTFQSLNLLLDQNQLEYHKLIIGILKEYEVTELQTEQELLSQFNIFAQSKSQIYFSKSVKSLQNKSDSNEMDKM